MNKSNFFFTDLFRWQMPDDEDFMEADRCYEFKSQGVEDDIEVLPF